MTEQEFMEDIHAYAERNNGCCVTYNDCIIIRCVQLAFKNNHCLMMDVTGPDTYGMSKEHAMKTIINFYKRIACEV